MLARFANKAFQNAYRCKVIPEVIGMNHVASKSSLGELTLRPLNASLYQQNRFRSSTKDPFKNKFDLNHPDKGHLVYVGTLYKEVKLIKIFSLSTSVMSIGINAILLKKLLSNFSVALMAAMGSSMLLCMTPLLLHWVTKRYVTNMYYNPTDETFTAGTYSLFAKPKDLKFKTSDITLPDRASIFTSILVNGKPLFLDPSFFLDRDAYVKLMKYDEPLDWEFKLDDKDSKSD